MTRPRQHSRTRPPAMGRALACVALLCSSGYAFAEPDAQTVTRTTLMLLDSSTGEVDIAIHPDMFTSIKLPSRITYAAGVARMADVFYIRRRGDTLTVKPREGMLHAPTSFRLESATVTVTMRMHLVAASSDAKRLVYEVYPKPDDAVCKKALAPFIESVRKDERSAHQSELKKALETTRTREQAICETRMRESADEKLRVQREFTARGIVERQKEGRTALVPEIDNGKAEPEGSVQVSLMVAEWAGQELMIPFKIENHGKRPVLIDGLQVTDGDGQIYESEMIYSEARDRRLGEVLMVAPKDSTTYGAISLPRAYEHDIEPLHIALQAKGMEPIVVAVRRWGLKPMTDAEYERYERAQWMFVGVRALYGGYWTDAGDDLGGLDGTTLAGVGVRFTKGFFQNLAFEAEIAGGRTGDATFAGVTWAGMQGTVTRRASLGRLQAAGVVRFGDQYIASTRLGVGVQLANYDSTMDVGGTLMDGPGDGFEVDGVWSVGAGFDARLGEHWLIGVAATFAGAFYTGARSLEGGLYLSYGWGGSSDD